jgi:hypothetical protein
VSRLVPQFFVVEQYLMHNKNKFKLKNQIKSAALTGIAAPC